MSPTPSDWDDFGTCLLCRALVAPEMTRCPSCETLLPRSAAEAQALYRRRRLHETRQVRSILIVYAGTLVTIVAFSWLFRAGHATGGEFIITGFIAGIALIGALVQGSEGLRRSFAGPTGTRWCGIGVAVGLVGFVVSWGWVTGVAALYDAKVEMLPGSWPYLVLTVAILPALLEEWTCRGVLWTATREIASERMTIVSTALVFAFLHGLEGLDFALPHRFAFGLGAGWLRAKSASLWPGILAHFVHNLVAISI